MQVKYLIFVLLAFSYCAKDDQKEPYPLTTEGSAFNTGNIVPLERACVYEGRTVYQNCFVVACDKLTQQILYVSTDGIVTISPTKCNQRK